MAKKSTNNTGVIIGIVVACVAVVAIIIGIVVANNKPGGSNEGGSDNGGSSSTSVEYDTVDEVIDYGDYEGMEELSKAIQNGEMVGKVVKINGIVMHPMSTYSVGQTDTDGSKKIGTQFIIGGAEDTDYPEDGDHVVITGEVVEESALYFVIKTTPNNVKIVE